MEQLETTADEQELDRSKPYYLQHVFNENKLRWCQILIRSRPIQEFHHQFSDRLFDLVSLEINKNKEVFNLFIKQPSKPLPKLTSPGKKTTLKFDNNAPESLQYCNYESDQQKKLKIKVQGEIQKAKYNYKKQLREKKKKQMQLTGSLKHLRQTTISPK